MLKWVGGPCAALLSASAHAGLMGITINSSWHQGGSQYCDLGNDVVSSAVEVPAVCVGLMPGQFTIDVQDSIIDLEFFGTRFSDIGGFNGLRIQLLDNAVSLAEATYLGGTLGITGLLVDFATNSLWIDMAGQTAQGGFIPSHARIGVSTTVPEPETITLFLIGSAGLLFMRRRATRGHARLENHQSQCR